MTTNSVKNLLQSLCSCGYWQSLVDRLAYFKLSYSLQIGHHIILMLGGDPDAELVRHFLIETTSRGVRLKGCNNEPVFGELNVSIVAEMFIVISSAKIVTLVIEI